MSTNFTKSKLFQRNNQPIEPLLNSSSKRPNSKGVPRHILPFVMAGAAASGFVIGNYLRKNLGKDDNVKASTKETAPKHKENSKSVQTPAVSKKMDITTAIKESRDLVVRIKDELGAPGVVIAVSVDGKLVWSEGVCH